MAPGVGALPRQQHRGQTDTREAPNLLQQGQRRTPGAATGQDLGTRRPQLYLLHSQVWGPAGSPADSPSDPTATQRNKESVLWGHKQGWGVFHVKLVPSFCSSLTPRRSQLQGSARAAGTPHLLSTPTRPWACRWVSTLPQQLEGCRLLEAQASGHLPRQPPAGPCSRFFIEMKFQQQAIQPRLSTCNAARAAGAVACAPTNAYHPGPQRPCPKSSHSPPALPPLTHRRT